MARNIVKDYLEYDRQNIKNYISVITDKKLNSNICDMIIDTYINIRYFNAYASVRKTPIDNIEYYVVENYKKKYVDKDLKKNVMLIIDALIILRYIVLYEKFGEKDDAKTGLAQYEEKIYEKYNNTNILVSGLIKDIKSNCHKKEKYINELLSTDFSVDKKPTNIDNVYDLLLDNSVKIPDLFSDVAVNRVYNSGTIYEDKMLVFYTLLTREILIDMISYDYNKKYLITFPESITDKKSKLDNLLSIINLEYLKERVVMKISYCDYKDQKDFYDSLIHDGYSFAIMIDDDIKDDIVMFNVFSFVIVDNQDDEDTFREFSNVIKI